MTLSAIPGSIFTFFLTQKKKTDNTQITSIIKYKKKMKRNTNDTKNSPAALRNVEQGTCVMSYGII